MLNVNIGPQLSQIGEFEEKDAILTLNLMEIDILKMHQNATLK